MFFSRDFHSVFPQSHSHQHILKTTTPTRINPHNFQLSHRQRNNLGIKQPTGGLTRFRCTEKLVPISPIGFHFPFKTSFPERLAALANCTLLALKNWHLHRKIKTWVIFCDELGKRKRAISIKGGGGGDGGSGKVKARFVCVRFLCSSAGRLCNCCSVKGNT